MRSAVAAIAFTLTGFFIGAAFFIAASLVLAWTGPTSAPPNGNVSAPINVGTTDQIKNAGLAINALAVFGNSILSGPSITYLNFGNTSGSSGYGIRDNNGVMEFRNSGGTWTPIPASSGSSGGGTSFAIPANVQNVNLYTLAGSPGAAGNYTITVNAGVTVGSSNASNPSITTGIWPAGSTVTLVNNGKIYGKGGTGRPSLFGAPSAGGTAIALEYNLAINNTNATIGGGGGGGGNGGGPAGGLPCQSGSTTGGNGGGGQGSGDSTPGFGNGGTGTATAPGAGGPPTNNCTGYGGYGGSGGTLGNPGAAGTAGSGSSGSAGAAGGKAVELNGKTVTWLGGNDAMHVKGAVQ